jgi:hypothetical protein
VDRVVEEEEEFQLLLCVVGENKVIDEENDVTGHGVIEHNVV